MNVELVRFGSDVELAKSAAAEWLKLLVEEYHKKPVGTFRYSVALSGGRITKTFFGELVRQFKSGPVEQVRDILPGIRFFWADERCVPPNDPECNYSIANSLLFEPLGVKEGNIHRLRGELPDAESLPLAIKELTSIATLQSGRPILDMVFLGMGEDGHVASLFPQEKGAYLADSAIFRSVVAVKPPPKRITLGFLTIIAAKKVWVLASGAGKEESLQKSLMPGDLTPLGSVLARRTSSKVLTDIKSG